MTDPAPSDLAPGLLHPGECVLWLGRADASPVRQWLAMVAGLAMPLGLWASLVPGGEAWDATEKAVRIVAIAAAGILGVGLLAASFAIAKRTRAQRYVVTNQRVLVANGAIVVTEAPVAKVGKVSRAFGAFDQLTANAVKLERAEGKPIVFSDLARPDAACVAIENALAMAARDQAPAQA